MPARGRGHARPTLATDVRPEPRIGNGRRASAVSAWAVTQTGVWALVRE